MLPIHKIIWHEWRERSVPERVPEPEAMVDPEQIRAYVKAYEWGGPTSALQLHHLRELGRLIRPGDTVLDMACGPGPLLLELAALYPDVHFIGADLSLPMLAAMLDQAGLRGLRNISALNEDISVLPSVSRSSVDLVISTSALHHLPDVAVLHQVFHRIEAVLKPDGGIYIFDFGLLRSPKTQQIMVAEVAKLAEAATVEDYECSLRAAFPIATAVACARQALERPFQVKTSSFVDFFFFLQTRTRCESPQAIQRFIHRTWSALDPSIKLEHLMLRRMRRSFH